MYKPLMGLFLFTLLVSSGCAISQRREAATLQNAETNRPTAYRRFARPRPFRSFIGFPYPVGVVGGIGGVGVGGACP